MILSRDKGTLAVEELRIREACTEIDSVVRQGKVELLLLNHLQGAHTARLDDLEVDLGVLSAESPEDMRQKDDPKLQRHRNPHLRMAMRHVADLVVEARDLCEDVGDLAEELGPVCCDSDLAPLTMKEVQPRLRLERLHGDGDGRLRNMQVFRCLRDVLPLADFIEIPHLYQRHSAHLPIHTAYSPDS